MKTPPALLALALLAHAAHAALAQQGKPVVAVQVADHWEFWDDDGVAFRVDKKGATTFNREIQKTQREMNKSRPEGAAAIPETGRVNAEMLQLQLGIMKARHAEIAAAAPLARDYAEAARQAIDQYRVAVADAAKRGAIETDLDKLEEYQRSAWYQLTLFELDAQTLQTSELTKVGSEPVSPSQQKHKEKVLAKLAAHKRELERVRGLLKNATDDAGAIDEAKAVLVSGGWLMSVKP